MSRAADRLVFGLIAYGSVDYESALGLRDAVLRRPLGMSVYDQELSAEAEQWHFGLWTLEKDAVGEALAGESPRAVPAGTLVACVVAVPSEERRVKLRQMAVAPAQQGRGTGARLLAEVETWLVRRGVAEVVLHARRTAAGFYARLGYRETGPDFVEVGIPHVRMAKVLLVGASAEGASDTAV